MYMSSQAINRRRHSVSSASMRSCVRGHILKAFEHDILETVRENFTKSTTRVQLGTKLN